MVGILVFAGLAILVLWVYSSHLTAKDKRQKAEAAQVSADKVARTQADLKASKEDARIAAMVVRGDELTQDESITYARLAVRNGLAIPAMESLVEAADSLEVHQKQWKESAKGLERDFLQRMVGKVDRCFLVSTMGGELGFPDEIPACEIGDAVFVYPFPRDVLHPRVIELSLGENGPTVGFLDSELAAVAARDIVVEKRAWLGYVAFFQARNGDAPASATVMLYRATVEHWNSLINAVN